MIAIKIKIFRGSVDKNCVRFVYWKLEDIKEDLDTWRYVCCVYRSKDPKLRCQFLPNRSIDSKQSETKSQEKKLGRSGLAFEFVKLILKSITKWTGSRITKIVWKGE